MSEPLSAGAVPLDEPEPSIEGAQITGPDPTVAPDPAPDDDSEPDGTVAGEGGRKYVPLDAVREARRSAKEAKQSLAQMQQELEAARQKAARFDELSGYVEQARPIIEAVRSRPDLLQSARQPAPKPAGPLSDADAEAYAKDLDLYKPDGTPDVERAQRLAQRQQQLAEASARSALQPLEQREAAQKATYLKQRVASHKDKFGQTVDPQILDQIWNLVPPELSSQENVAALLHRVALAESLMQGKIQAGVQVPPAVATEGLGGPSRPEARGLSDPEERFRRAADIDSKSFASVASKFKPGAVNTLE